MGPRHGRRYAPRGAVFLDACALLFVASSRPMRLRCRRLVAPHGRPLEPKRESRLGLRSATRNESTPRSPEPRFCMQPEALTRHWRETPIFRVWCERAAAAWARTSRSTSVCSAQRLRGVARVLLAGDDQRLCSPEGERIWNQPFEGHPRGSCASGLLSLSPVRTETVLSRRRKRSPHESTYAHDRRECSDQLATSGRRGRKEHRRADDANSAVTRSRGAARILARLLGP